MYICSVVWFGERTLSGENMRRDVLCYVILANICISLKWTTMKRVESLSLSSKVIGSSTSNKLLLRLQLLQYVFNLEMVSDVCFSSLFIICFNIFKSLDTKKYIVHTQYYTTLYIVSFHPVNK